MSSPDPTLVAFLALTLAQLVLLNLAVLLAQRGRRKRTPAPCFALPPMKEPE